MELYQLAVDLFLQRLRREQPDLDEDERKQRLAVWVAHRPGAEHGDAEGRPVPWPRAQRRSSP